MLYSKSEILDFCHSKTRFASGITGIERMDVLSAFADEIASMPLYRQVILIEGGKLNHIHLGSDGYCDDETLDIFWGLNAFGKYGFNTFHHEDAHRVDVLLHGGGDNFSNICPLWQSLVDEEFGAQEVSSKFQYHSCSQYYEDSKTLANHMSGGYPYEDYDIESFAEISTHYTCLYRDFNGDHAKVDERLSAMYPKLWAYYRDIAIPEMVNLAAKMNPQYAGYLRKCDKQAGHKPFKL